MIGTEADAVRAMPCLCRGHGPLARCEGAVQAAHAEPRGGRLDLVPLCTVHHAEAGEAWTPERAAFERRYGRDLRDEADLIALKHAYPLGVLGLAQRWALEEQLGVHERVMLLEWVQRRMEAYLLGAEQAEIEPEHVSPALMAEWLAPDLDIDETATRALCDAVGWLDV